MNDKICNSRKNFEKLGNAYNKAENVTITKEIIENVNCYWFHNKESADANKLIVYLHGGCFVLGSMQSHQSLVSHLAANLSVPILFIEYGLAPELPFPQAVNEILMIYKYLLLKLKKDIILMGDSAGAGLAVSTLSKINREGIQVPAKLVMLSPWIDLNCNNGSYSNNADLDPVLTKKALQDYASLYVGDNKLSEANPIENMSGQFPETLILVGSGEVLLDDSKTICSKIEDQQVKARLSIYDKQNHVWMLEDIHTEESKKALKEIKKFVNE